MFLTSGRTRKHARALAGFLSQPNYVICQEILSVTQVAVSLINSKDDGFMDHLLPNHTLQLVSSNSMCTRDGGVLAGLEQVDKCGASEFGRVVASIGTACSDSSTGAQDILKNENVPMISYAATSTALSDKNKYPLFGRTVPSDITQAPSLLALVEHYNVTRLGVLSFDDPYSKGIADAFRAATAGSLTASVPGAASAMLLETTKAAMPSGNLAHLTDLSITCKLREMDAAGIRHLLAVVSRTDALSLAASLVMTEYLPGVQLYFAGALFFYHFVSAPTGTRAGIRCVGGRKSGVDVRATTYVRLTCDVCPRRYPPPAPLSHTHKHTSQPKMPQTPWRTETSISCTKISSAAALLRGTRVWARETVTSRSTAGGVSTATRCPAACTRMGTGTFRRRTPTRAH